MEISLRSRALWVYFASFGLLLALNLLLTGYAGGDVRTADGLGVQEGCPGEQIGVQITGGEYLGRPVPEAVINGEPWGGAYFEPGMRSYWHCHAGGQLLVVWEGEGRVQKRGERARTLSPGESEHAGPWEEHWHGASPTAAVQYLQVSLQPTGTYWMEEVNRDDYLGNDVGINSRDEFLRTGVREQPENP